MGWPSVKAGLQAISSRELTEWQAYENLYGPINPQDRADLRMAILASTIANIHRDQKAKPEPFTPEDFMPKFGPQPEAEQTPAEMLSRIEMLNQIFGGVDLRDKI